MYRSMWLMAAAVVVWSGSVRADVPPPNECSMMSAGDSCNNTTDGSPGTCQNSMCAHGGILPDGGFGTTEMPCLLCLSAQADAGEDAGSTGPSNLCSMMAPGQVCHNAPGGGDGTCQVSTCSSGSSCLLCLPAQADAGPTMGMDAGPMNMFDAGPGMFIDGGMGDAGVWMTPQDGGSILPDGGFFDGGKEFDGGMGNSQGSGHMGGCSSSSLVGLFGPLCLALLVPMLLRRRRS